LALTTLQSINAEIKQLEAQRKLVEKRDRSTFSRLPTIKPSLN